MLSSQALEAAGEEGTRTRGERDEGDGDGIGPRSGGKNAAGVARSWYDSAVEWRKLYLRRARSKWSKKKKKGRDRKMRPTA